MFSPRVKFLRKAHSVKFYSMKFFHANLYNAEISRYTVTSNFPAQINYSITCTGRTNNMRDKTFCLGISSIQVVALYHIDTSATYVGSRPGSENLKTTYMTFARAVQDHGANFNVNIFRWLTWPNFTLSGTDYERDMACKWLGSHLESYKWRGTRLPSQTFFIRWQLQSCYHQQRM